MPRTARASVGGMLSHSLNQANRRDPSLHKPSDDHAWIKATIDARARLSVDLLGFCPILNYFYVVLRKHGDGGGASTGADLTAKTNGSSGRQAS